MNQDDDFMDCVYYNNGEFSGGVEPDADMCDKCDDNSCSSRPDW